MTRFELTVVVGALAAGVALLGRAHRLATASVALDTTVSVVIPARDEERRLPHLLRAVARTTLHEVFVVDDGSTDDTAAVAERFGATVLDPGPPPAGWTGKTWACARGAAAATGDVLVFFDADVEPTPRGIVALAAAAYASGGLVSAQPGHRIERRYEGASAGPALVTILGAGTGTVAARTRWRQAIAFGPAMAISAAAYRSFGGHHAVRGAIDDDLALARVASAAGLPVEARLGDPLLRYRMYPGGPAQLIEGWTKNLATGAAGIPRARLVACVLWVTGALSAALDISTAPSAVAACMYAAFAIEARVALRRVGRFGLLAWLLYPVTLLAFVALFARSAYRTVGRHEVRWRGRDIPIRGAS